MRAFIALPLPEETAQALERLQSGLPFGRAMPRDNLHLTLAFLGDVDEGALEALHFELSGLRTGPVEIDFGGLGTFGEAEFGLIFAEVARSDDLSDLQARIAGRVRRASIDLPRRRFRPHVTLARANRAPRGAEAGKVAGFLGRHATTEIPGFTAASFCLYGSTLTPGGAVHEVLAEYPLG